MRVDRRKLAGFQRWQVGWKDTNKATRSSAEGAIFSYRDQQVNRQGEYTELHRRLERGSQTVQEEKVGTNLRSGSVRA